ncbi:hypothetical protein YC2023_078823 [Brassica napus]
MEWIRERYIFWNTELADPNIPYTEVEFPLFPHIDVLQDEGNTLFATHLPHNCLPDSIVRWFISGETQRTLSSPCGISSKSKGYWKAHRKNPNQILFLNYETNLSADPLPYVKRLAEFMGYGFTAEEEKNGGVEKVVNLCSFETLKNLETNKRR